MSTISIVCGLLLILIGLAGYGYGMNAGNASPTALIPAGVGLILLILGFAGRGSERSRKHVMHAAVLIGLLGFIAALVGLFRKGVPTSLGAGPISQIAMAIVCLVFVILAVRSFIDARRSRSTE